MLLFCSLLRDLGWLLLRYVGLFCLFLRVLNWLVKVLEFDSFKFICKVSFEVFEWIRVMVKVDRWGVD